MATVAMQVDYYSNAVTCTNLKAHVKRWRKSVFDVKGTYRVKLIPTLVTLAVSWGCSSKIQKAFEQRV